MTVLAVLLTAAAVVVACARGPLVVPARLERVLAPRGPGRPRHPGALASVSARRGVAVFAGCCCAIVVGGFTGAGIGLLVAGVCDRGLRKLETRGHRHRRERLAADLPVAADLLAGCLLAGSTLVDAAESVATAVGGPLAAELRGAVAAIRLGSDPAAAWLTLAREPATEPLARTVARAVDSGAPLADAMARLADDQRAERRRSAGAAAERVGVRAVVPLGVCFLPAFFILGVLPAVGGIAERVLSG